MGKPDLADDIRALEEALAAGPTPGPHHIYTHPRDDNNHAANEQWHQATWPQRVQAVLTELQQLRDQAARYHWLCTHLTQIHVETTQPAGSPADTPMRVTLMQVWPELPSTDAGSVDAAVAEAMKEGA